MECFVWSFKSGMGCFVRGDRNGVFRSDGKSFWMFYPGIKNGMGRFVWLPQRTIRIDVYGNGASFINAFIN